MLSIIEKYHSAISLFALFLLTFNYEHRFLLKSNCFKFCFLKIINYLKVISKQLLDKSFRQASGSNCVWVKGSHYSLVTDSCYRLVVALIRVVVEHVTYCHSIWGAPARICPWCSWWRGLVETLSLIY